jgi:preprotein translocase subunit YajC
MTIWNVACLLAEAQDAAAPADAPGQPNVFGGMLPALVGMMLLFYFLILRPEKKRAGSVKTMRESLKKNDRVLTTAGIYGVVTNIQRESNEVTIKVDEATNAKLRVTLESIVRVLGDTPVEDGTSSGATS